MGGRGRYLIASVSVDWLTDWGKRCRQALSTGLVRRRSMDADCGMGGIVSGYWSPLSGYLILEMDMEIGN